MLNIWNTIINLGTPADEYHVGNFNHALSIVTR